ncbi:BadM/Rrf2 family transcriptional regulator [Balneicella halophila]|uniref:BadM/Rrf2 family transcriptional regulator n=1 Tax=Balneicella halophila TaxID=1537566 RepID=A0A7L4UQP4_BALHA|nr:Rrf2 family transcriptional regulator [Balneicella halophila]PVX52073.1 BadM/Rrf2 family transcriptional regulator [Balneicella halophila]
MLASASKYALKIVIYLAKNKKSGKIGGKKIAEDLQLSAPFVGKVLQPLAHSGIVKSTKGPHGGFVLASEPNELPLLNIIQIFEGENVFKECLLYSCNCKDHIEEHGEHCRIHEEIAPAREKLLESLRTRTVADFLNNEENNESLNSILDEENSSAFH